MINKKGFTLIELLVVIAIIALLLSILMPALGMSKEIARRVVCSSKLKGLGTALHLYSNDYKDKMIPNAKSNATELSDGINSSYTPWYSRIVGTDGKGNPSNEFLMATNHGKLYSLQYIDEPRLYYCPSAFLSLKGSGGKYEPNYYFEDLAMYMPPPSRIDGDRRTTRILSIGAAAAICTGHGKRLLSLRCIINH